MKDQEFEAILRQALQPEIAPEETIVHDRKSGKGTTMNMKNILKKACLAAALMTLLTTTVYAAGGLNIKTLWGSMTSKVYDSVAQAEAVAGFEMDDLEMFSNGYGFAGAHVGETKALDEKDKVRLTYKDIHVDLVNAAGEKLSLTAHEIHEAVEQSSLPPRQTRRIGETVISYRVDHYKYVPADYELTPADQAMLDQPGWFLSYGAETVDETDVAFTYWEKDGIRYLLMDDDAAESAESLFSMAEELVRSGK